MRFRSIKLFLGLVLIVAGVFVFAPDLHANLILKVIIVNPSKEQTQNVPLKAYLPKEVKPDDVLEKGDLEVAYDTQQGSYYVTRDFELKPGETLERDIEIRDIWSLSDTELESLRIETIKIADLLKNTEFADRVSFLKNNIESKLNQIIENQRSSPANPEQHISDYRDNLRTLENVKADMALSRSLLSQAKPLPTIIVWRLIIAIIIFLGILAASFFFIWQKQAKVITQETFPASGKEEYFAGTKPSEHKSEDEKQLEPDEIEKLLGDEDKDKPGN